ncbi:hypothetical protein GALMADRAFT_253812 [Galerina marginata CBS 339.88]|uniref:Uncharacterized protein n=1 Tax=Galerina marginata (strain CBS 339.88) TaxID=685588 RepID=A0A067SV10_GALM3|nr:hypothetical protein GALMADRAFT_253812 [Galerina marginata CBS 339.88]
MDVCERHELGRICVQEISGVEKQGYRAHSSRSRARKPDELLVTEITRTRMTQCVGSSPILRKKRNLMGHGSILARQ